MLSKGLISAAFNSTLESLDEVDYVYGNSRLEGFNDAQMEGIFVSRLIFCCCIVTFVENVLGALVAPFFGEHAIERFSASTSTIGMTLSVYPFVSMISSPFCGILCNRFGRLKMVYFGLLLMSLSLLAFGESQSMSFCILSRIVQGVASACINVGMYAVLARRVAASDTAGGVPGLARAMGAIEAFGGCGDMAGPAFGGALFHLLPWEGVFPLLAALPLLLAAALPLALGGDDDKFRFRLPSSDDKAESDSEDAVMMKGSDLPPPRKERALVRVLDTKAAVLLATTVLVTLANDFSDATLARHFATLVGGGALAAGLLYAVPSVVYPLVAAAAPRLARAWGAKPTVAAGLVTLGASNLLLGPAPFLRGALPAAGVTSLGVMMPLLVTSLVFWGAGMALSLVPLLPLLQGERDESDHIGKDIVASLYNAAWSAGEMLGPVTGGLLCEVLPRTSILTCVKGNENVVSGFPWASAFFGGMLVAWSCLFQKLIPSHIRQNGIPTPDVDTNSSSTTRDVRRFSREDRKIKRQQEKVRQIVVDQQHSIKSRRPEQNGGKQVDIISNAEPNTALGRMLHIAKYIQQSLLQLGVMVLDRDEDDEEGEVACQEERI
mmetsp:Transcript_40972/g.64100  ORF Transcript_40972/g.64100 Transcript_40972/m.64100 type:complete len:607 (+) Transcript_40972:236-2056(+)